MSDTEKSPKDRLLDLLVYGPAGLAVTAAEEFPKLVDKGRHRMEGQIHTARLVGQFAVQMGRQQIEQTVSNLLPRQGSPKPAHSAPAQSAPAQSAPAPSAPAPSAPAEPTPVPGMTTAGSSNGTLGSDALGIPGYDSLSASQVVQRLGGLSAGELEAVREHEVAHRHRRTILNRVEQLLAGAEAEPG